MGTRWLGLPVAGLLVTGLLAGCGSSGSPQESQSEEIPIGVIGSYSGSAAANIGPAKATVQAWANALNDAGGINGRKVHLYIEDDQATAQIGVAAAKRLVEQHKVVAFVGQYAPSSNTAWADYVAKKGIPVVGGSINNSIYLTEPGFFTTGGNIVSMLYGIGERASKYGDKIGVVYCAELPTCATNVALFNGMKQPLGISVGYDAKVSASAPDFTAVCQGLKSSGVKSYVVALAAPTVKKVVEQCIQQGVTAKLIVPDILSNTFAKFPAFEDVEIVGPTYPFFATTTPAAKTFRETTAKYAPTIKDEDLPLNGPAIEVYIAGKLFEAAVKASGTQEITSESVMNGLYALKGETLEGLAPPLTYVKDKPNMFQCYYSWKISGGVFVADNGAKPTCVDPAKIAPILEAKLGSH